MTSSKQNDGEKLHDMFRFCLIYGSILLVIALSEEATPTKRYNGPIRKIPGKNEQIPISDGKTKLTGEFGDQFGSPSLKIHSSKSVLTDGTQVLDLTCSAGSAAQSIHNFVWWRKGAGEQTFSSLVAMSAGGVIMWPTQRGRTVWNKYQQIKDKQLVEGDVSSVTTAFLTLHIPLEPCEDEGLFKCSHTFKRQINTKPHNHDAVFHFNKTLVCGRSTVAQASAPNFPKHVPSAVATILEDEKVNYADLALTEMAAIIGLVVILIVTITCCVCRRKKANNEKEKDGKEKKSDTNLPARRKSSRSRAGMTGSTRNLNSRSHLSSHRQPSYSSTGPTYHSPRPQRSRTSDMHMRPPTGSPYRSMTRMGGPPPPPTIGGPPPAMGGPPPPPTIGGPPPAMGGHGPPAPPGGPPPPQMMEAGPQEAPAAPKPERNAFLASINARRTSSSRL